MRFITRCCLILLTCGFILSCPGNTSNDSYPISLDTVIERPALSEIQPEELRLVLASAGEQTEITRNYTQDYFAIPYPNGDVPPATGACTDVVIRAFRKAGVDLQKEVHEDMVANFAAYPKKWGLTKTDTNIDHRRVPNLQTFLARKGKALSVTSDGGKYRPGDIVS